MNENDSTVVLRRTGTDAGQFNEVRNVKRHENSTLSSRNFKWLGILDNFKRDVSGGGHHIVSASPKSRRRRWRHVSVK